MSIFPKTSDLYVLNESFQIYSSYFCVRHDNQISRVSLKFSPSVIQIHLLYIVPSPSQNYFPAVHPSSCHPPSISFPVIHHLFYPPSLSLSSGLLFLSHFPSRSLSLLVFILARLLLHFSFPSI